MAIGKSNFSPRFIADLTTSYNDITVRPSERRHMRTSGTLKANPFYDRKYVTHRCVVGMRESPIITSRQIYVRTRSLYYRYNKSDSGT